MAQCLARGMTYEQTGKAAGVCARTVFRRMEEPEFRNYFQKLRLNIAERTISALAAASITSLRKLKRLLENDSYQVQLSAAKSILDLAFKASLIIRADHSHDENIINLGEEIRARVAEVDEPIFPQCLSPEGESLPRNLTE
ncbi:MAG: hypothetical protein LC104_09115 [Bacteroidales bacterium]|nr:hypothetical protein [Bacteroidales bacterium]